MSEDVSTPVPEFPGDDPGAAEGGPHTDGYGLSDSPAGGSGRAGPAGPPEQVPGAQPADGAEAPADGADPSGGDDAGAVGHA